MLSEDFKLTIGVRVNGCLSLPCDAMAKCLGFTRPLVQCQLGLTPASPVTLERDIRDIRDIRDTDDGWMNGHYFACKHWLCDLSMYLQTSPELFCSKDRTRDIDAIHQVIQSAETFIFISVTDYLPLVNRRFRGTSVTRYRVWLFFLSNKSIKKLLNPFHFAEKHWHIERSISILYDI